MTIYRYTLNKYIKSWSTYIISGVTFVLIFLLGGVVAFNNFNPDDTLAVQKYAILSVALVAGITGFLSIFTSVFAGFKSATMFKDEVEDGTFLVMLSKPVSRSKIIFEKWLALISILFIYTFFISLTFLITILVFDKGYQVKNLVYGGVKLNTLSSQIWTISLVMWGILSTVALIFSSIALLISTKLSVGSTIGISIALGVVIPITSLVQTFTKKEAFNSISSDASRILDTTASVMGVADVDLTNDAESTYSLGIDSGEVDSYRGAFVADINFQINVLASYASEKAIPDVARQFASQSTNNGTPGLSVASLESLPEDQQGLFKNVINDDKDAKLKILKANFDKALAHTYYKLEAMRLRSTLLAGIALNGLETKPNHPILITNGLKSALDKTFISKFIIGEDTLVNALSALAASNDLTAILEEVSTFITGTVPKVPTTPNEVSPDVATLKKEIYYSVLMSEVYSIVSNNSLYFEAKTLPTNVIQPLTALNIKVNPTMTLDEIMTFLTYNSWLNSPLSLIDTGKINKAFKAKEVALKGTPEFLPATVDTADINSYGDAVNYLLNGNVWNKTAYQEITSMMDEGYNLKRVYSKDYVHRSTLLYIYLAIAFGLVPLAYLSIRRQDFR